MFATAVSSLVGYLENYAATRCCNEGLPVCRSSHEESVVLANRRSARIGGHNRRVAKEHR